jgi:hypothetical protein
MKRLLLTVAGMVAGAVLVGIALVIVHSTIGQPVDPHQVCIDTGYGGAYNTEDNGGAYTWRCFHNHPGDVADSESELDIAAWCQSPVRVHGGTWECLPEWYPFGLSGL